MLKRLALLAALLVALVATVPIATVRADRAYTLCDPFKNVLCRGLVALYEFEEDANSNRTSETGSAVLIEPDAHDIDRSSTHKTGSYSFVHTANAYQYLKIPHTASLNGVFTLSFWIYVDTLPSADGKFSAVLCVAWEDSANCNWPGLVTLVRSGANTYPAFYMVNSMTDGLVSVAGTTAIGTGAWHMVTMGQYPTPTSSEPYQWTLWIETDNGTRVSGTMTAPGKTGLGNLFVGAPYSGGDFEYGAYKLDQLGVWGRVLTHEEVGSLYASGSGRNYPFN